MLVGSIGLVVVGVVCAREVESRSLKRDPEVRESEGLSLVFKGTTPGMSVSVSAISFSQSSVQHLPKE